MDTPRNNAQLSTGILALAGIATAAGAFWLRARAKQHRLRSQIRGRRVLITGGSRGLGFSLAREFARLGASVAICGRDRMALSQARTAIAGLSSGPEQIVFAQVCDVTDRGSVERMVQTVQERLGGIDILVNNAGTITLGPLETMTTSDFEYAMKVHFWGPLYTMLAVLPAMKARKRQGTAEGGRIVNISSIGGRIGVPQLAPYCASKFALQGLSESLQAELHQHGIAITTICPGIMRTGGHINAHYKGQHQRGYAWMNAFNLIPGFSVSAEHAARRIVEAAAQRQREVVIGGPAQVADKIHAALPNAFAHFEALAARLLPRPGGIGQDYATGRQSEPGTLPRWVKKPIYRDAQEHNQFAKGRSGEVAEWQSGEMKRQRDKGTE